MGDIVIGEKKTKPLSGLGRFRSAPFKVRMSFELESSEDQRYQAYQ